MKWLLIIILVLAVAVLLAYMMMAIQSQKQAQTIGLKQGMLQACPNSPNCVCSEDHTQANAEHAINPIPLHDHAWINLKSSIIQLGGNIEQDDGNYLHATFSSTIFHFVDDVELHRDAKAGLIQIRSASRAGRSDFGVNRKRVAQIVNGAE